MTIQRVSTYSLHQSTLGDVSRVQANLAELQGQISSGKKTNNFKGLGGKVEHFVSLENKMARTQTYIDNNNVILARVNTTQVVMNNIIETVDDMEDLLLLRQSSTSGESLQFRQQILAMRDRLSEMVNTTLEGRYLFGGTRTSSPPMSKDASTATPGVPDSSYYQGSTESLTARVDDNTELNYAVRADAEGFQKVVAAITQALQASDAAGDPNIASAHTMMQDGLSDLIAEQAKVNANIVAIEAVTTRHQDMLVYWQGVTDNVINTDIVAASTQVAIDQTVLQAAFQSFATINNLRLVDFLR